MKIHDNDRWHHMCGNDFFGWVSKNWWSNNKIQNCASPDSRTAFEGSPTPKGREGNGREGEGKGKGERREGRKERGKVASWLFFFGGGQGDGHPCSEAQKLGFSRIFVLEVILQKKLWKQDAPSAPYFRACG